VIDPTEPSRETAESVTDAPDDGQAIFLLTIGDSQPIAIRDGTQQSAIDKIPEASLKMDATERLGLVGVDLNDEALLEVRQDGKRSPLLSGVVYELNHAEDRLFVDLRGTMQLLEDQNVAIRPDGVPRQELISYLLSLAGISPEHQDIDGFVLPKSADTYLGIVPIEGCLVRGEPLLGKVCFYSYKRDRDDDDRFNRLVEAAGAESSISAVRARVSVTADNFLEADALVRDQVNRALDWIAFRTSISEPVVSYGGGTLFTDWSRDRARAISYGSPIVYLRRQSDNAAWAREALRFTSAVKPEFRAEHFLGEAGHVFERVLSSDSSSLSDEERSVLLSLHWYRRARQDERPVDRLVDYWTSLEHVLAQQPVAKLFTKEQRRQIKERVLGDWRADPERLTALEAAIDGVNQSPLPRRLDAFVAQHATPLSDSDQDLLWKTREKRNDVVHGRAVPSISNRELDKLSAITGRFILRRALALGHARE